MSHDWRLRADNLRDLHPTRKLILLKLAEHANTSGWCDLAIDTIADYAAISPDQARRLLRRLERDGLLAIEIGGGRSHVNRYWLLFSLPTPATPLSLCRGCRAPIYWVNLPSDARAPISTDCDHSLPPIPTTPGRGINHFTNCPAAKDPAASPLDTPSPPCYHPIIPLPTHRQPR